MTPPPRWTPSRRVFIKRAAGLAAFTFAAFAAVALMGPDELRVGVWAYLIVPAAVTAVFVLEDFGRWRRVRDESWRVEAGVLLHETDEGCAQVPLSDIARARPSRLMSGVVLKLHSGKRIAMRYLDHAHHVAEALNTAARAPEKPLVQPPN